MELSGSNVLRYELADGTTILVRPSGTEPKIKVYILTIGDGAAARDENLRKYGEWAQFIYREKSLPIYKLSNYPNGSTSGKNRAILQG